MGEPIYEGFVFKATAIGDYVVKRYVKLYADRFVTEEQPGSDDQRTWRLDAEGALQPAIKADITRKKRYIRPSKVGHLTALAAVAGSGAPIELYMLRLDVSFHDFKFGCQELQEAEGWHDAFSKVLADLRSQASSHRRRSQSGHRSTADEVVVVEGATPVRRVTIVSSTGGTASPFALSDGGAATSADGGADGGGSSSGSGTGTDEGAQLAQLWDAKVGVQGIKLQLRWVPYSYNNGVAIYRHQAENTPGKNTLGEFMVSAVVRGSPLEVLRVLLNPRSNTTILGPASEIEVLESEAGRQVLRVVVAASGAAGRWCRPREAVVQRLLKKEEDGVYVLLFSSVSAASAYAPGGSAAAFGGVIEEPAVGSDGRASKPGVRPVRMQVHGGYTVSRLEGARGGVDSAETLITCALEVDDLGGWLSPLSSIQRLGSVLGLPALLGWSDVFVERMLMTVMLVKDQVEQSRFAVKPQLLHEMEVSEAPHLAAASSAAESLEILRAGSSTFVMRRAYNNLVAASGAAAAAAAAAGGSDHDVAAARIAAASVAARPPPVLPRMATVRSAPHLSSLAELLDEDDVPSAADGAAPVEVPAEQPPFSLPSAFYEELHTPGRDAPFRLRGPTYLQDRAKYPAGEPVFELLGVELLTSEAPVHHISRYLPCVRHSPRAFLFVLNLIIPGPPTLSAVFVYATDKHPASLGQPPEDPDEGDWQPFDYLLFRFLNGTDDDRRSTFKLIPHVADGSWVVRQSVGTTPVILGRKLATQFAITDRYVEVSTDVGSNSTAQYVTGMVRGVTKSLTLDMAVVLEGHASYELPEVLLGACRLRKLDLSYAKPLDTSNELPLPPSGASRAPTPVDERATSPTA